MQHALDLVRPFWPLILALVVWPLVGAALSWWLWWDTPEHWEAYAKAHPGRALAIRALRTVSPHLRKLVVAWRDYASARSSLPPLGIALPAEKTGALVVSETRPVAHPTPADGVAFDAQRDAGLVAVDAAHLFESNTTRLALRRGTYLRSYAHAFIEKVCPDVGEEAIKAAIKQQNGNDG